MNTLSKEMAFQHSRLGAWEAKVREAEKNLEKATSDLSDWIFAPAKEKDDGSN